MSPPPPPPPPPRAPGGGSPQDTAGAWHWWERHSSGAWNSLPGNSGSEANGRGVQTRLRTVRPGSLFSQVAGDAKARACVSSRDSQTKSLRNQVRPRACHAALCPKHQAQSPMVKEGAGRWHGLDTEQIDDTGTTAYDITITLDT